MTAVPAPPLDPDFSYDEQHFLEAHKPRVRKHNEKYQQTMTTNIEIKINGVVVHTQPVDIDDLGYTYDEWCDLDPSDRDFAARDYIDNECLLSVKADAGEVRA
jgi:hypothetical protein